MSRLVGLDEGARGGSELKRGNGDIERADASVYEASGSSFVLMPTVGSGGGTGDGKAPGSGGGTERGRGAREEFGARELGGGRDAGEPEDGGRDDLREESSQPASSASSTGAMLLMLARLGGKLDVRGGGTEEVPGKRGGRGIAGPLLLGAPLSPTGGGRSVASMRNGAPHALHEIVTTRPRNLFS